jgi:phosphoribosylanthranilate isomerase
MIEAKICGLSTARTVEAAVLGGAAYVGFVFYPPSPRAVTPELAAVLSASVPKRVQKVGLVVDADDATLGRILDKVDLDILQLHGQEEPERCRAIRARFGRPVMKAIRVGTAEDIAATGRYVGAVDRLLFDAHPPRRAGALPGGNGEAFDWTLLAGRQWPLPWMLSGGLNPAILGAAVRVTGAAAVDVSSGVESSPGIKDLALIRDFLERARSLGN